MWRPADTNTHAGGLTETVSSVVTMATLWLPQVDATDGTTAGVLSEQHGGNVALLELLKTKQRGEIRGLSGTDRRTGDLSHLQFEVFGAASG